MRGGVIMRLFVVWGRSQQNENTIDIKVKETDTTHDNLTFCNPHKNVKHVHKLQKHLKTFNELTLITYVYKDICHWWTNCYFCWTLVLKELQTSSNVLLLLYTRNASSLGGGGGILITHTVDIIRHLAI